MLRYMLDTNTVIFILKNRPPLIQRAFNEHAERLAISTVVLSELVYGTENSVRKEQNLLIVEGFTARLTVLAFDERAAYHTGQIRAELRRTGRTIGPYDSMIAGHARSAGLVVVTNNSSEFERVPGLQVEDWLR